MMISVLVMLWWATSAIDEDHAWRRSTGPASFSGPSGRARSREAGSVCVAIQCLAACSMQKRAAGIASSRAAPIGFPQTSQMP